MENAREKLWLKILKYFSGLNAGEIPFLSYFIYLLRLYSTSAAGL